MTILTKKTAKFSRNKITTTAIAILLILSMTSTVVLLPSVNAAITYHTSYVYAFVSPTVIGVGQQVLLVQWPADLPPDIGETTGLVPGGRAAFYGCSFNVTTPGGVTTNYQLGKSDPVGGGYLSYTPTEVGTYTVIAIFPETWKNTTTNQIYYSAAVSPPATFTAQAEPAVGWSEAPLPTEYWTRPINDLNRNWYALAGDWLGGAAQNVGPTTNFGYGIGPESAHVMWTKPYYDGGIMDERYNVTGYETYFYQGFMFAVNAQEGTAPIIINGKLYYDYRTNAHQYEGYLCVDLYTGATIFYNNATTPSFGQIYNYESPNQHGGFPYLWKTSGVTLPSNITSTTTWEMCDGYTGNAICDVANVSSAGTSVYGVDGSILRYNIVNYGSTTAPNYHLTVWNSSAIPSMLSGTSGTNYWSWRPAATGETRQSQRGVVYKQMYVHDGSKAWSLNVSIPNILGPSNAIVNQTGTIRAVREGKYVIIGTAGQNDERGIVQASLMAVSLEPGQEGTKLWTSTLTPPYASTASNATISMGTVDPEDNVVTYKSTKLLTRWGYDLKTGQLLWTSAPEPQGNYYGMTDNIYRGMLLTCGYGGVLLAYNIRTGEIIWNYTATSVPFESAYGGNYPMAISNIVDGKIYIGTGEHSWTQPLYRGSVLQCINASNGALIWNLPVAGVSMPSGNAGNYFAIADGYLVALNGYDAQIYCIGKGPSATTVSAPQTVPSLGSSIMIIGAVTDQTATGRGNDNGDFYFTLKGTPAISDASMSAWMQYMFMQQVKPTDAIGVPVTLNAIDPNGNYVSIGTVTSDNNGNYGLPFTPEVPGTYQIIATFAGSNSYGPSSATTYLAVGEAAATASPYPEISLPPTEMYIVGGVVAIIIAIAIVGASIMLMLRKRP
jgi:hypothetical protein